MPQRCPHRFHRLPRQHRSHRLNRHGNDKWNFAADFFRDSANRQELRLDIPGILAGLDQQEIHPAVNQSFCLGVISLAQFAECASAASPYSARTIGAPPNEFVSTMSEPASKYFL